MTYRDLHAPLTPILRRLLREAALPSRGLVLDLACGDGEKTALLAEAVGPDVRLVGVDLDRAAGESTALGLSAFVCGDAHALPLRDGCLDAAVCIAALGLFTDRRAALRELRRALRPGAPALIVTAEQRWALVTRWPDPMAALLAERVLDGVAPGVLEAPEAAGNLADVLTSAGFGNVRSSAFLLEPAANPALLALPLLQWAALRPLAAHRLAAADLARCDAAAPAAEVELVPLTIAAVAVAEAGTGRSNA